MFGNNNSVVVKRLTTRSLKTNKSRNIFIVSAIILTMFLLTSVFSVGMSMLESIETQKIRMMGTVAHAAVTLPTEAQIEKLRELPYVKTVGLQTQLCNVKNTPQMGDVTLSLFCFDKNEWEQMRRPACSDVVGNYPQAEDEIMLPAWVLERFGINEPEIGTEIPLSFYKEGMLEDTLVTKIFKLSGWYTNFMHIRSGNIDTLLVSEAFAKNLGKTIDKQGSATVIFTDSSRITDYCVELEHDLSLSDSQNVKPVPIYDVQSNSGASTFIALAIVVMFLIFTGYLLIYNVLYISVSRDIRFYGLLKTIGTTPRQIRRIVRAQVLRLCIVGIPVGAVLSALASLIIIPMFLSNMLEVKTGVVISFSPLIYIGAALFTLLTSVLGSFKPAKKAASISPVEAQKYTGIEVKKARAGKPAQGKPHRMAIRNIFRDRKRAAVVLLSLFLGITTFMMITTVVASMDMDNYVASYMESDIVFGNNTVDSFSYQDTPKQKFDRKFIEDIKAIKGVKTLRITTREWMSLSYTPEAFGDYWTDYVKRYGSEGITEDNLRSSFSGLIAGIDAAALGKVNSSIDLEAFERGEFAFIATDKPELFDNTPEITITPWRLGESGYEEIPGCSPATLPVGGFVPMYFHQISRSIAPTIYVSISAMEKIYDNPLISKLNIDVQDGFDEAVLSEINEIISGDYEIYVNSKLDAMNEIREVKQMLNILGGGIGLILALIGILNFVNVMSVGIMVRRREIATMESVGMSRKQVRAMLFSEGFGYALITILLVMVFGNAAAFGLFHLFHQEATYAVFTYPFVPVFSLCSAILAICVITPEIIYRVMNKLPVVERLREAE